MPAVTSTRPSRQPSIKTSKANQSRGRRARSAQSANAKAGIAQVSG